MDISPPACQSSGTTMGLSGGQLKLEAEEAETEDVTGKPFNRIMLSSIPPSH